MINKHVIERIKSEWKVLAEHGYSEIEKDLVFYDGKWHKECQYDGFKPLGRVAFWKQKELDGVVISEKKGYTSDMWGVTDFTDVNMIGKSYNYFNKLYKNADKSSKLRNKEKSIGKVIKTKNGCEIIDLALELYGTKKIIKLNDKKYNSMEIGSSYLFHNFLEKN